MRSAIFAIAIVMIAGPATAGDDGQMTALKARAESGDADAEYWLGVSYLNGQDLTFVGKKLGEQSVHFAPDLSQAVIWLTRAAAQGRSGADVALGDAYAQSPLATDKAQAIAWYGKAEAHGDATAMAGLCDLYWNPAQRDLNKAEHVCAEAARHGLPKGYFAMAQAYETGDGITADPGKAISIYIELGDNYQPAIEKLAFAYHNGGSLAARDEAKALTYFQRLSAIAPKTYMIYLAQDFEGGLGTPANPGEAARYFYAASVYGNADAKKWLATHRDVTADAWISDIVPATAIPKDAMHYPQALQASDLYPAGAVDRRIAGTAVVDCQFVANGRFDHCLPVSETPPGYGFASSTLRLVARYASIDADAAKPYVGRLFRFSIGWKPS